MAGKGGGAWKVAYADFVTAMMAFFLVMWLCAQDQKVREAVADYFVDPTGSSKKPGDTGALFRSQSTGNLPHAESVALGRGRKSHSSRAENGQRTKLVSDWLHADEKSARYWRNQALLARELAPWSKEVREGRATARHAAVQQLSRQLREEVAQKMPAQANGLYQELMHGALADVNWTELAEDLLAN